MKRMNTGGFARKSGFTLMEMLIVVAIIAVLVAIAIPVFVSQLERARESTDLANVRSAYAQVMTAAVGDTKDPALHKADGTYEADVKLVQAQDGWTTAEGSLNIAGVTPADATRWVGTPAAAGTCRVKFDPATGIASFIWSGAGNAAYLATVAPYKSQTLMALHTIDNAKRVAADVQTLTAIGEEILSKGWTKKQLEEALGILVKGGAVRIANFYQDKTGSFDSTYASDGFRIEEKPGLGNILSAIGFDGGKTSTNDAGETIYANSLFYSDELATNQFKNNAIDQTKRSIILDQFKTDSSGKVSSFRIYAKAMDDQANMNEQEKAQFRVTVTA